MFGLTDWVESAELRYVDCFDCHHDYVLRSKTDKKRLPGDVYRVEVRNRILADLRAVTVWVDSSTPPTEGLEVRLNRMNDSDESDSSDGVTIPAGERRHCPMAAIYYEDRRARRLRRQDRAHGHAAAGELGDDRPPRGGGCESDRVSRRLSGQGQDNARTFCKFISPGVSGVLGASNLLVRVMSQLRVELQQRAQARASARREPRNHRVSPRAGRLRLKSRRGSADVCDK